MKCVSFELEMIVYLNQDVFSVLPHQFTPLRIVFRNNVCWKAYKLLEEQLPTNKFSSPEEIANFVLFLCSKYASQSQGSVMAFDGGMGRAFF